MTTPTRTPTLGKPLSGRELDVLRAVADGLTNTEIGQLLTASPCTVKTHLEHIGRKIGTGDRAGMVGAGFRAGWLR